MANNEGGVPQIKMGIMKIMTDHDGIDEENAGG